MKNLCVGRARPFFLFLSAVTASGIFQAVQGAELEAETLFVRSASIPSMTASMPPSLSSSATPPIEQAQRPIMIEMAHVVPLPVVPFKENYRRLRLMTNSLCVVASMSSFFRSWTVALTNQGTPPWSAYIFALESTVFFASSCIWLHLVRQEPE